MSLESLPHRKGLLPQAGDDSRIIIAAKERGNHAGIREPGRRVVQAFFESHVPPCENISETEQDQELVCPL